jgi:hypothetical protein
MAFPIVPNRLTTRAGEAELESFGTGDTKSPENTGLFAHLRSMQICRLKHFTISLHFTIVVAISGEIVSQP